MKKLYLLLFICISTNAFSILKNVLVNQALKNADKKADEETELINKLCQNYKINLPKHKIEVYFNEISYTHVVVVHDKEWLTKSFGKLCTSKFIKELDDPDYEILSWPVGRFRELLYKYAEKIEKHQKNISQNNE